MPDLEPLKILFVCSMNQWRSPTAEKIYSDRDFVVARSCGINRNARKRVTKGDVKWADIILVMEQKHKQRLLAEYQCETRFKEVSVLDIPDDYRFMEPELVDELTVAVEPILTKHGR